MRKIYFIVSLITLFGCTTRNSTAYQQFHYHDDGKAKPMVAIVPIYDKSKTSLPWNISQELTESFNQRITTAGKFYLTNDFNAIAVASLSNYDVNPFLDDIGWIGDVDTGTEFIVFLELVEHHLSSNGPGQSLLGVNLFQTQSLDMVMRIKVIDIRDNEPKIILQELIEETYFIPWRLSTFDYKKDGWGKTAFAFSPIGLAHGKMIKKVAMQVEEYITLAKVH